MVESDDEFAELCSKLLKRVKKTNNPIESQNVPKASTAARGKVRRTKPPASKKQKKDGGSRETEVDVISGPDGDRAAQRNRTVQSLLTDGLQDDGSRGGDPGPPDHMNVKDLILERMQQFKRTVPSRMKMDSTETSEAPVGPPIAGPSVQNNGAPVLQMDVKEKPASLEDQGLFFCQLCQKDLTAMSGALREQHVNRCLDQVESLGGNPVTPLVPSCPLCGKPFSTEKSRASHLKRCAAKLEVPAQTLLQAVQRQAAEAGSELPPRVVNGKRRGVTKQKEPSKKRKVGQTGAEMEDLMVAMAMSRSMQEDKKAQNLAGGQVPLEVPAREKKSRRKQKEKPTPLLLLQAPEETKEKLQKRLSMLLTEEAAESRVLTLPPSHFWSLMEEERESWKLRGGKGSVLWEISNMMEKRDSRSYYTAELVPPITPWKSPMKKLQSSQTSVNTTILHPGNTQTAGGKDPQPEPLEDKNPLSDSQRALLDLAELAGEGMTLTQWNGGAGTYTQCTGRESPVSITSSGFIPAQEEKSTAESRAPDNKLPLLVLSADFMEMVNNPHLSDAQLQTDCGEVLHAHMFVLYARCPLLVEAIHSEGFWVAESGTGRARRLLLNDVSTEAALCFLQFLYSATTDVPSHCLPHVCELGRRFDVKSLIEVCESLITGTHNSEGQISTEEEGDDGGERAETFQELLKSMWLDEGEDVLEDMKAEDEEKPDDDGGGVGEGELEEIYEFALTQRKMLAEQKSESEEEMKSEDASPKSRNLTLEESEGMDLVITTPPKVSPNPKVVESSPRKSSACLLSNSPEYSVVPSVVSSAQAEMEPSSSSSDDHINVAGTSPPKQDMTSPVPVISLISPNRDEDPEADMFAPHSPSPLDDSYDRMFSQTCGEYGEQSDMGESRSQTKPASPPDQQPVLTSSPTAMPHPTPGSSPNIRPQSFLDRPSYSSEREKSLHCSFRYSLHCTTSQNSKEPSSKSQDADVILISSSDEEVESSNQSAAPSRTFRFDAPDLAKAIKESPVSFIQGRRSEGFSRLEMSSSSEMSWLVPATPLPQLASSKISPLQTSCLPQTTLSLQMSHTAQSPPKSKVTSHATQSPPNSWRTSHTPQSPPKSRLISHTVQSPPKSRVTSHATQSPSNSWRTSHTPQSPPKSRLISHTDQSPPKSKVMSHIAQSPPKSKVMSHTAQSPLNSQKTSHATPSSPNTRKTSHITWSHPNSQKSPLTTHESPQSSQASRNFDLDVSCKSFVSQTQASPVSLPSMSPRPPPSLRPSIQESLEAKSSACSKAPSSPPMSTASSTVFEVGDSEDEAPAAEVPANISNCSFQFDYDEPPIPMEEDLWGSMNESPKKSPAPHTPSHSNKTPTKALNCNLNSPSPAKSTTSANIEGSPQYAASQSSRQSYFNSRLWEDWDDEDPKLPAVLSLSQRLNSVPEVQKKLRTPVSIVRRRELAPKVPITPLPDYSDMDTPILKKELSRFGVRALPKKKMVLKLKEIFRYTHQVMSSESEEDVPSSQPHQSKGSSTTQVLQKPAEGKQRQQNSIKGSSSSYLGRKGTSVCAAKEPDPGDDQPLTASQESTTSSVAASDTSSLSQSSNTNEFETAFADEDDDEAMPASQAASKEALAVEAVRSFIETHPELHKRVLLYQPLDLVALQAELKQNGIKIAAGKLLDFLDSHCITFTTAAAHKEKKSRTRRKAGKRY